MATVTVLFDAISSSAHSASIHFRGFPSGTRLIVVSEQGSKLEINFDIEEDVEVEVRWDGPPHRPTRVSVQATIPKTRAMEMLNLSMEMYPGIEMIWHCPGREPTLHELISQDALAEEVA